MARKVVATDEPPYETSGRGMPVVGSDADHHRRVDDDREEHHPRQAEDQEHAPAVARHLRERQRAQEERREEAEHEDHAEESPLLGDDRQDEVGVLHRQEAQLALRPGAKALPEKPPEPTAIFDWRTW